MNRWCPGLHTKTEDQIADKFIEDIIKVCNEHELVLTVKDLQMPLLIKRLNNIDLARIAGAFNLRPLPLDEPDRFNGSSRFTAIDPLRD